MKKNFWHKSFTLIEMLIVIVIIGILAAALIPRLQSIQGRARDSKRKVDVVTLNNTFSMYLLDNGEYPPSSDAQVTSCPYSGYGVCGVGSRRNNATNGHWISGLVSTYIASLPIDPINNASQDYPFYTGDYGYYYGEVYSGAAGNGNYQPYDLIVRLENTKDPLVCYANTGSTYFRGSAADKLCVPPYSNGGWGAMERLYQAAPAKRQ